jgi:biotin carboxyl carrier protein
MKIQVQKNNSIYVIEVPNSLNLTQMNIGEKFTLYLYENQNKIPVEAQILGDKRSLAVGNDIIPFRKFQNNPTIQTNLIRPVQPKKRLTKKGLGDFKSPMTGKIISIQVKQNEIVKEGDVLLIIEAMKMENRLLAEGSGLVKSVSAKPGTNVTAGETLLHLVEVVEK